MEGAAGWADLGVGSGIAGDGWASVGVAAGGGVTLVSEVEAPSAGGVVAPGEPLCIWGEKQRYTVDCMR